MLRSISLESLNRSGQASRPLSREPLDRRFLRSVYLDLAGRTPLPAEQKASLGKTRAEVVEALAGSATFFEEFYERELFYFLLIDNFRPSTSVFERLVPRLAAGQSSVQDAVRQIVSSQFFNARNPGNDTFVTVVLEQLLGMTVQKDVRTLEAGKRMYDGREARFLGEKGSSQADLVRIVVLHEDFETFFVNRKFGEVFSGAMPRAALRAAAAALRERPAVYSEMVAGWLTSEAYEAQLETPRPMSDRMFVRSVFVDLLRRVPEYQEYRAAATRCWRCRTPGRCARC